MHCVRECKEADPYPPESGWRTAAANAPIIVVSRSRPCAKRRPAAPTQVKIEDDDEDLTT